MYLHIILSILYRYISPEFVIGYFSKDRHSKGNSFQYYGKHRIDTTMTDVFMSVNVTWSGHNFITLLISLRPKPPLLNFR